MIELALSMSSRVADGPVKGKVYTQKASMPYPLAGVVAELINNMLYVTSGNKGNGGGGYSDTMLIYDIVNDSWTESTKKNAVARYMAMSTKHNNSFYLCGGRTGAYYPYLERYDPVSDTWTRLADCPVAVADGSFVTVGDRLYLYGGLMAGGTNAEIYYYDVINNTWHHQPVATNIDPRRYPRAFQHDQGFIICGGQKDSGITGETWYYNTYTNTWTRKADGPVLYGGGLAELGGHIYMLGGWNGSAPSPDIFEYNIGLNKWSKVNTEPGIGRFSNTAVGYDNALFLIGGTSTGSSGQATGTIYRID